MKIAAVLMLLFMDDAPFSFRDEDGGTIYFETTRVDIGRKAESRDPMIQ
jgi:hypothetical protein